MKRSVQKQVLIILLLVIGVRLAIAWVNHLTPAFDTPYSPSHIEWDDERQGLWVLEATVKRIDFLDTGTGELQKGQAFNDIPTGFYSTEENLLITTDNGSGELHIVDKKSQTRVSGFPVGKGARSPVFIPSKDILSVCNTWRDEIGFYSYPDGKLVKTIKVLRQPFISVLSKDEKYLFVANFITHQRADQDTVSSAITVVNMENLEIEKHLLLANGSNALRGMALSSNGEYVLVSHNLGRFQVPTTQLEQGWMNTSALSVVKVSGLSYEGTVLLDEPEYGAAGSWGIDCDEGVMVVAHSGTHDISLIDENLFFEKLESTEIREILSYDLNFLGDIRQRIKLPGNGPRNVAVNGSDVFVGMYFSDTVNHVNINDERKEVSSWPLNDGFFETEVRLGEKFFNDAKYCFQGWQSCNGCHPMEARTDGLNWDLLNDGIGNPKNCKSMLLSHATPPAMITGIRADAETAVRAGFKYIQFAQVPEDYTKAVDAYLSSLEAVPSPFLIDGNLSEAALRGKGLYSELGCIYCHPAPYYTDLKMHTFVSPNDSLGEQSWDTPTLVEVWRSGPWMHDGRCADMKKVFAFEKHGLSTELNEDELNDLVEYVLSL